MKGARAHADGVDADLRRRLARRVVDGTAPLRRTLGRLAGALFVLWAVATLTFFAIRLVPGDPAQAILGGPGSQASQEALDRVRADYGLDQPLLVQYLAMLGRLATGDLGDSYALRTPVAELIGGQLAGTLRAGAALARSSPGCSRSASRSGRPGPGGSPRPSPGRRAHGRRRCRTSGWRPCSSRSSARRSAGCLRCRPETPTGLVLPVVTLAIPLAGFLAQLMREHLLDALEQPFALVGPGPRRVGDRHPAAPCPPPRGPAGHQPVGLGRSATSSRGAVVVETIFARPGLGRTLLRAVELRDVPVVARRRARSSPSSTS